MGLLKVGPLGVVGRGVYTPACARPVDGSELFYSSGEWGRVWVSHSP